MKVEENENDSFSAYRLACKAVSERGLEHFLKFLTGTTIYVGGMQVGLCIQHKEGNWEREDWTSDPYYLEEFFLQYFQIDVVDLRLARLKLLGDVGEGVLGGISEDGL